MGIISLSILLLVVQKFVSLETNQKRKQQVIEIGKIYLSILKRLKSTIYYQLLYDKLTFNIKLTFIR